jgi:hypothetical protein
MAAGGKREGAGRRPLFEKTTLAQIRIASDVWEQIPEPKAEWIRKAIDEKIDREKRST